MANDPKKPSPLTAIEREGDAARIAAAQELAQKVHNDPSLISAAEFSRLGTSGIPVFLSELRKSFLGSATELHEAKPSQVSATKSSARKGTLKSGSTNTTQPEKVGKGNADIKTDDGSPKPTPRPPHNLQGWAHLRVRRKTWPGGFTLGLLVGAMLLLLGVLMLGLPMLQFAIRSH